jgi:hypothetical protein
MANRPTSILVVSILGILLAAFGILASILGIILTLYPLQANDPTARLAENMGYLVYHFITSILWIALGIILLAGSIQSLRLKPIGRKLMLFFAWAQLALGSVGAVITFIFVIPAVCDAYAADPRYASLATTIRISEYIGGAIGVLLYIATSLPILYFFNRKIARNAFNGIFPPPRGNFPIEISHDSNQPTQYSS